MAVWKPEPLRTVKPVVRCCLEKSMQFILLCMAAGTVLGASLAVATEQTVPQKSPRYLARFDEQFSAADKDSDGALSREEAQAAHLMYIVNNFGRLDANHDGKITRDEIRTL